MNFKLKDVLARWTALRISSSHGGCTGYVSRHDTLSSSDDLDALVVYMFEERHEKSGRSVDPLNSPTARRLKLEGIVARDTFSRAGHVARAGVWMPGTP